MAKFNFQGLAEYEKRLSRLGPKSEETAKKALYQGAKIYADKVHSNLSNIPTERMQRFKPYQGMAKEQKAALLDSMFLTKMKDDNGVYNIRIGFAGYNKIKTHKYPQGQPNAMIASSVEGGSIMQKKRGFMAKAIKEKQTEIIKKMGETIDQEIEKIMR